MIRMIPAKPTTNHAAGDLLQRHLFKTEKERCEQDRDKVAGRIDDGSPDAGNVRQCHKEEVILPYGLYQRQDTDMLPGGFCRDQPLPGQERAEKDGHHAGDHKPGTGQHDPGGGILRPDPEQLICDFNGRGGASP